MRFDDISSLFGAPSQSSLVDALLGKLNTLNRPALPDDDEFSFHDWVLVRRKGVELGFVDSEYQSAAPRHRWGHGELLLTQAYFYSGFDDIKPYTGELPFRLIFGDSRDATRAKLAAFESTRHSYRNDTWDVDGYRLSVTYGADGQSIDRIACRVVAALIARASAFVAPALDAIADAFGETVQSSSFRSLWQTPLTDADFLAVREDGELDFIESYGATIGFAESGSGPIFRSITLHRNRDMESAGWCGALPQGLDFDDDPDALFRKIPTPPEQQADSALTGHAVWHFAGYTLHVLYSNLDNRLLRIKLIAPGTWKCMVDVIDD